MEILTDRPPVRGYLDLLELIEDIFQSDEANENLTEAEARRKKLEILFDTREHLVYKRLVAEKLSDGAPASFRSIGADNRLWKSFVRNVWDKRDSLIIWNESIKNIEGEFGSGVGSYFRFLRVLLSINVFSFLMSFGLIFLPQILFRFENQIPYAKNITFADFVTGEGWLGETELFYGSYTSGQVYNNYEMPKAYFFTNFSLYLVILLFISVRTARLYSKSFIQAHATVPYEFFNKVFAGWDFTVVGKNVTVKKTALRTELKLLLDKSWTADGKHIERSNWMEIMLNIFLWVFAIGVMVGIGFGLNAMLDSQNESEDLLSSLKVPLTVTALMLGVPWLFSILDSLRSSDNASSAATRSRMYQTLTKTILLEMTIISVLIVKYYKSSNPAAISCWENDIGQEMYRLLLLFFFGLVLITFIMETAYKIVQSWPILQSVFQLHPPEFEIARNTMHLIYGQTLTWIALYYSPISSSMFIFILLATFYIKQLSLKWNCSISTKPWIAAQSETVYFVFTFLSLLGVSAYFIISISSVVASNDCGPFKNLTHPYDLMLDTKAPSVVFQPGVAGICMAALIVIGYYVRALHVARRRQVIELKLKLSELRQENDLLTASALKARCLIFNKTRRRSFQIKENYSRF